MEVVEKKIVRDWSELPTEILKIFCKRLPLPDQIRFGSVCKSWFSSAFKRTDLSKPPPDTPWLITTNLDRKNEFLLLGLSQNKYYEIQKPFMRLDLNLPYISCSFKGWLVIQSKREIHIRNLFSKVLFKLPPLSTMPDSISSKGPKVMGMEAPIAFAISTFAHLNPTIIAVATLGGDLALCKIGDTAWKGHHQDNNHEAYANLTFFNAKLYAINKQFQKLDIFEVDDDLKLLLVAPITISSSHSTIPSTVPYQVYLVESGGNLLVVKRYCDKSDSSKPTIGFEILKVEEDHGSNPPRLGKVDKLKEQVLLLGNTNSECVAAKDCGGFAGNHIYFTGMSSFGFSSDIGVYFVEEKTLHRELSLTKFYASHWVLARFAVECNCALPKTNSV